VKHIRIGVPQYISVRPLIHGLIVGPQQDIEILYDDPGILAEGLDRGALDVALIPSIEYLRGAGRAMVEGPALVARATGSGVVLVSQKPVTEIERIAVHEWCRAPIVVLRTVLHKLYGVMPDLLVEKNLGGGWREKYDAVLVGDDAALDYSTQAPPDGCEVINVVEMWGKVVPHPLPLGLWVYTDTELTATFSKWLMTSRNLGLQNLSRLADGIAATSHHDSQSLYDYFTQAWSYQLDDDAMAGLRALESLAIEYDLMHGVRLEKVLAPQA